MFVYFVKFSIDIIIFYLFISVGNTIGEITIEIIGDRPKEVHVVPIALTETTIDVMSAIAITKGETIARNRSRGTDRALGIEMTNTSEGCLNCYFHFFERLFLIYEFFK